MTVGGDYREVGLEWVHSLPSHWTTMRGKYLFRRLQRPAQPHHEIITAFRDGTVTLRANRRTEGFTFSEKEIGYQGIREGDLVVHAMDGFAGAIGVSDSEGKASPVYSVLRPREGIEADPRYYAYLLRFLAWSGFVTSLGKGIRERSTEFRWKDIGAIEMPYFDLAEQQAIASFLDLEAAKIDELIAKKEILIELLEEKRAALIVNAVTKGLNPSVLMEDTDVEWLGEIPEHWETKPVKCLFDFLDYKRVPVSGEERSTMDKIYPYYGASGVIDYVDDYIFDEPLLLVGEDGANLVLRSTPIAFVATGNYWVNNHAHVLRPREEPLGFWEAALQVYDYDPFITGSAQPKLNKSSLGNLLLPVPPESERHQIAAFLEEHLGKLTALDSSIRHGIDRLSECKAALISAAVTGRIDVRAAAAA